MFKNLLKKIIILSVAIVASVFSAHVALADTGCANNSTLTAQEAMEAYDAGVIAVSFNKTSTSEVKVTISNNTTCTLPATVQSYKMYDNDTFDTQVRIHDAGLTNISANSSRTFSAPLASCLTQVDAFYDNRNSNSRTFVGKIFGTDGRTFDSIPSAEGTFCGVTPPPNPSNLNVSCEVDDSSVDVDEDVHFTANVSGGNGSYAYNWSGSEGLFSTNRSFDWSFDNDGTKRVTLTVFSGSESQTDTCSVDVNDNDNDNNDNLSVSCYAEDSSVAVGERVRWYAEVDGDDGDIDYDWSGDDGLDSSSRSPSITYYNSGTKEATVRVRSNGDTDTAHCTVRVTGNTVLSYNSYNPNNQVLDAVYLNEVPYTGLADNVKLVWFIIGLALFSAYVAYVIIAYKKQHNEAK